MKNNNQTCIKADTLFREYEPGRGICGLSLNVVNGECLAIMGRNGSGKSTFLRLITGLEPVQKGSLTIWDKEIRKDRLAILNRMGIVLESSAHWDKLSGRVNANFVANQFGLGTEESANRIETLLKDANLLPQADSAVKTYSFGMRRKLSLIEALCHHPDLLILDEPTIGIDIQFMSYLANKVNERKNENKTTLICSNNPEWVALVADRVAFLEKGVCIACNSVEKLIAEMSPLQEITIRLASSQPISPINDRRINFFKQEEHYITAVTRNEPGIVVELMEQIVKCDGTVNSLEVKKSSLSDAFALKTGKILDT